MKEHESMGNLHERCRNLIDRNLIEGLTAEEQRWLEDHMAECGPCATRMASTEAAVRAVKSVSIALPRGLAASTKLRVREQAANHKRRRARNLALIAGCAVSWVAGVASAPLVWRMCEWVGTTLYLPRIVWQLGFLSWWLVPAACAGLVVLWARPRADF